MTMTTVTFAPDDISINRGNPQIILASYTGKYGKKPATRVR